MGAENRVNPRFATPTQVVIQVPGRQEMQSLWTANISKGGLFVITEAPPAQGTQVSVRLETPEGALDLKAEVVHTVGASVATAAQPAGAGLQFQPATDEQRDAIQRYVAGAALSVSNGEAAAKVNAALDKLLTAARTVIAGVDSDDLFAAASLSPDASEVAIHDRLQELEGLFASMPPWASPAQQVRLDAAKRALQKVAALKDPSQRAVQVSKRGGGQPRGNTSKFPAVSAPSGPPPPSPNAAPGKTTSTRIPAMSPSGPPPPGAAVTSGPARTERFSAPPVTGAANPTPSGKSTSTRMSAVPAPGATRPPSGGKMDAVPGRAVSGARLEPVGGPLPVMAPKGMEGEKAQQAMERMRQANEAKQHAAAAAALCQQQKFSEAVAEYQAAVDKDPNNASFQTELAYTKSLDTSQADGKKASKDALNAITKKFPKNAQAHFRLAQVKQAMKDDKAALDSLRVCLDLDKGHEEAQKIIKALEKRVAEQVAVEEKAAARAAQMAKIKKQGPVAAVISLAFIAVMYSLLRTPPECNFEAVKAQGPRGTRAYKDGSTVYFYDRNQDFGQSEKELETLGLELLDFAKAQGGNVATMCKRGDLDCKKPRGTAKFGKVTLNK